MNLYFLLEDEKSLLKTLPLWFEHLNFKYCRVADIQEVRENNYILQSGQGVTQLVTRALFDTIDTIRLNPGKIDMLVVILDAEELDADVRKQEVNEQINKYCEGGKIDFDIEVLVCNRCFETWLLGCCGLYPMECPDTQSDFYKYYIHYNVEEYDPEKMKTPEGEKDTTAKYHFHYLHELLRYRRIRYSKNNTKNVATEKYFKGIVERVEKTEHLSSFKTFYDFICSLNVDRKGRENKSGPEI